MDACPAWAGIQHLIVRDLHDAVFDENRSLSDGFIDFTENLTVEPVFPLLRGVPARGTTDRSLLCFHLPRLEANVLPCRLNEADHYAAALATINADAFAAYRKFPKPSGLRACRHVRVGCWQEPGHRS